MKPIYKSVILTRDALAVSLSLQANVYSGDATATQAVPAESLQGLRVQLVSPNVSGARDLIASGECTIDGATLNVSINAVGLIPGTHRLVVKAEYGTQTVVLYGLDITVPASFEEGDAQEFEDEITVVETIGDSAAGLVIDPTPTEDSANPVASGGVYDALAGKQPVGNYADGAVYAKDEDNNAHITTPLSIGDGVAASAGAVASGYADNEGSSIQATNDGAVASGRAKGDNSIINAGGSGAVAIGCAKGDNSIINAGGSGAVASGYTEGAKSSIQASGDGAVASGRTDETSGNVEASGQASQAFGIGVQATQDAQMVLGKCNIVDTNGDYAFIVGNGADDQNRSNAFAIDWNGNLVLFKADGTPVILTAAVLESLIASV